MQNNNPVNHTIKTVDEIFFKKQLALPKQREYCYKHGLDMYASFDGICYCGAEIPDNGDELITGCRRCHRSFVD